MHEASIAQSIFEMTSRNCLEAGYSEIKSIRVRIGRGCGVQPDALMFAFEALKAETIASGAALEIEVVPLGGTCNGCMEPFETEEQYILSCPRCGSSSFKIEKGYEMDIVDMEVN